jgi:hypothetical protein
MVMINRILIISILLASFVLLGCEDPNNEWVYADDSNPYAGVKDENFRQARYILYYRAKMVSDFITYNIDTDETTIEGEISFWKEDVQAWMEVINAVELSSSPDVAMIKSNFENRINVVDAELNRDVLRKCIRDSATLNEFWYNNMRP